MIILIEILKNSMKQNNDNENDNNNDSINKMIKINKIIMIERTKLMIIKIIIIVP